MGLIGAIFWGLNLIALLAGLGMFMLSAFVLCVVTDEWRPRVLAFLIGFALAFAMKAQG